MQRSLIAKPLIGLIVLLCVFSFGQSAIAQDVPIPEDNLDELIATLENEDARNRLIAKLDSLRKASVDEAPSPDDAVDQVVDYLKQKQSALDGVLLNVVTSWNRIPEFVTWLQAELLQPIRRDIWLEVAIRLTIVFFSGWVATWILGRFWRQTDATTSIWPSILRFLRSMVMVSVYAGVTFSMLYSLDQPLLTRLVGRDLVIAFVCIYTWRAVLEDLCRPFLPEKLGNQVADDIVRTVIRAGSLGLGGYFILRALLRLGLPWSFHSFGEHILFIIVAGILVALVIRLRQPIAEQIRAFRDRDPTFITRLLPMGLLAQSWHVIMIGLILAHYLTWALSLEGGLYFLAQATFATAAILFGARLLSLYNDELFTNGVPLPVEDEFSPEVQERASRYASPLRVIFRWVIIIAMILALSWVWKTGLMEWLASENGQALTATVLRLGLVATIAILLSEGITISVNRFVQATLPDGQAKLSNRAKTLATLLKNASIVVIVAVAIMLALSEIGVDAAALLAGAGVIGLAIGFGSQKLVQDLINGLFILLGDTVRVGDVIEVGGKAGSVESMSMRTISLRAYDGNVHTVPYSSIDTVTNMTKDFSFAVFELGISYGSDLELAFKEMQALDQAIRREWPFRRQILAPLEIAGVEALADSAVIIKARSKTRAGDQWVIRREMTKRIKRRFDEVGIEIPFPHRTLMITSEKKDSPTPLPDHQAGPTMSAGN